jgi:hypothetical protein
MSLSNATKAKIEATIDALTEYKDARVAEIEADAEALRRIKLGTQQVVPDVVEEAADEAQALLAEVLAS